MSSFPLSSIAKMDGTVWSPPLYGMSLTCPSPKATAAQELVVPRSIPMIVSGGSVAMRGTGYYGAGLGLEGGGFTSTQAARSAPSRPTLILAPGVSRNGVVAP